MIPQEYGLIWIRCWDWSERSIQKSASCMYSVMGRHHSINRKEISYTFLPNPFKCGFETISWHFFEASHGKGAPDGVGGTHKRTADRLVHQGRDSNDAEALFRELKSANTTVKLFFIDCRRVQERTQQLSTLGSIPIIKGTMAIHQIVCSTPGMLTYRDASCVCSAAQGKLDCACHQPKAFLIEAALLPTQDRISQHDPVIWSDGGHTPEVEAADIAHELHCWSDHRLRFTSYFQAWHYQPRSHWKVLSCSLWRKAISRYYPWWCRERRWC